MTGKIPHGLIIVASGPSGAGKNIILRSLLAQSANYAFSITATTRAPRPGEVDGVHYFFYDKSRFQKEIDEGGFLEWERYNGTYYGTVAKHVIESVNSGKNIILDIGAHGAMDIKAKLPEAVTIFILPPSLQEYEEPISIPSTEYVRLSRGMTAALKDFDYVIYNDDVNSSVVKLSAIVLAESLKVKRLNMATSPLDFTLI